MSDDNYKAWNINENDFPRAGSAREKLLFLLRYAILAPSSHNTQPWKFRVDDTGITVCPDLSRRLPRSDESGRMIYTALGTATENTTIAANHFGILLEGHENPELARGLPQEAIRLEYGGKGTQSAEYERLFPAIQKRVSYRARYADRFVPQEILQRISTPESEGGVQLAIFFKKEHKNRLAEICGGAMKRVMAQRSFRWELAHWLRTNISSKRDGMPGEGHGMSLLVSILAPFLLRFVDVSKVEQKKAILRVNNFPAVGVLSSVHDNALDWFRMGRVLERILLTLTSEGLGASIMVAPIEDKKGREELFAFLHEMGYNGLPQIFFGFGYPLKQAPHSPRRPLGEVLL